MKKMVIFALLLTSFAAAAQSVYVRNNYFDAQISIWNRGPRELRCSGPLTMFLDDGRSQTQHQFLMVRPHGSTNRSIRPMGGVRIRHVSHNIWCR